MTHTHAHGHSPNAYAVRVDDGSALSAHAGEHHAIVDPDSAIRPDDYVLDVDPEGCNVIGHADAPAGDHHRLGPVVELRTLTPAGERMGSNRHE